MDKQHELTQDEVAQLLAVSIDTLKQWRTARLAGTQLALVPTGEVVDRSRRYTQTDLVEWLVRNPARLALLQFASEERRALLPMAMAAQQQQPEPINAGQQQQQPEPFTPKGLFGLAGTITPEPIPATA